jgi:4-amino-4-deoxy-L-arabinose transferase-like glycosyltransferase
LSDRISYGLVVLVFLGAAFLRFWELPTLPSGFHADEIADIRITETARQGRIEVFYDLNGQGREGLYQALLASVTSLTGGGLMGYRLLSVWAGLITLALLYAVGKRLFGALAGLTAVALLAVSFWPVLLARSVSREALVPLFVTAVLLALARSLPVYGVRPHDEPRTVPFAALGLLLGLGFYVHPVSYVVTLAALLFIVYILFVRRPIPRRTLSYTWFAVVVLIVAATPYLIASLQLPALSGARRLLETGDGSPLRALVDGVGGLFFVGDADPTHNLPGRPMFELVSGLLLLVGLFTALRYWRQPRFLLLLIALVLIAPVALLSPNSPNFLHFAPLLPIMALLFGIGVSTLVSSLGRPARQIASIGLVALLLFNFQWTFRDLFINWPTLPPVQTAYQSRLAQIAGYLDYTTDSISTVVCTPVLRPQAARPLLASTQLLALMMHRQNVLLRYADCGTGLILSSGGEREQVVLPEADTLEGLYPALRDWLMRGELVHRANLPTDAVIMLDVASPLADQIGSFTTTAPVAFAPEAPRGEQVAPPPLRFGGNVTFLGYEHRWAAVHRPGDVVPVVTYWRVDGVVPPDLRLFAHILADPGARPAAQSDEISVLPEQLRPRDVFIQVSFIQLPRSIRAGEYSISIGAYEGSSGIRLPVFDGEQPGGTRLFVGGFRVE